MNKQTNKEAALIALNAFATFCRDQLAGRTDQIAQVDAVVEKAESLSAQWYDDQGYQLHNGHGSAIADGRAVAQAVTKA